jgi:predicted ATPase/DNA-binding SARP family transcriptional activator
VVSINALYQSSRRLSTHLKHTHLILHPGTHAREKLASLFWGDSSDVAARGSLRKALTLLRKHIGNNLIIADRETVQVNQSFPVWVDVSAFEIQAQELLTRSSPELNQFEALCYQGELLSDFYDDWILPLREYYRTLYLDVMLRAVEQSRAQSEYKLAIEYAQKILAIDVANERAHQHLMFCYITLGDRNKALQQYEACQRALCDELAAEPARETQVLYDWIKGSTPDIQSLAARITNLPIPISSFVGRNRELARIKRLLASERLVTLTGAGGSGKTRLAIHAATDLIDSFKDGVWWVELVPLSDAKLVPSAVAKALGIDTQSDQPLIETLAKYLQQKQILLVLDNCEHLIEACAKLVEYLLLACTELKILTTSREALGLTGEKIWQVPTMSLLDAQSITLAELLMQYEGINLFVERASTVGRNFALDERNASTVAQVCQQLDGIPLAIELAAARIKTMSIEQIAKRLDDRFQLLTAANRTAQARHQTLRAAIDWSYELLSEAERRLFCRLSVFSGGWTLEAAEAVCSGDGIEKKDITNLLARLVDKSLVTVHAEGQPYGMLETMKQYGNEKLTEEGGQERGLERHLDYYLKMANKGDQKLRGPEQFVWLKWFDFERDNLASAMEIALNSLGTLEKGCELVCSLCWYWKMVGDYPSMKNWLEMALSKSTDLGRTPAKAKLLLNVGLYSVAGLHWLEPLEAQSTIQESLEIWQKLGPDFTLQSAQCMLIKGWTQKSRFDNDKGYDYFNRAIAIFEKENATWWHAWALNFWGSMLVQDSKDVQTIQKLLEEETTLWKKTGDQCTSTVVLWDLGDMACERGDFIEAQGYYQESLQRYRRFGAKSYIFQSLVHLGDIARGLKQYDQAEMYYKESMSLVEVIMWEHWLPQIYLGLGYVMLAKGEPQQAQNYFRQALYVGREFNLNYGPVRCIAGYAATTVARAKLGFAARLFGAFFAQLESLQSDMKTNEKIMFLVDQTEIEGYLALCKSQIKKAKFEQAWNDGYVLSLDDVVNEILRERV